MAASVNSAPQTDNPRKTHAIATEWPRIVTAANTTGRERRETLPSPRERKQPMERLTGLDATFLYLENPTNHMHVAMTMVLDPSTMPGGYSFEKIKEFIGSRLHLVPPFRRRLVEVPFNLHHPVWVEDPDFDLDYHIRRIGVPGSRRAPRAGRDGRPDRQHPARPHPPAVGAVGDRGPQAGPDRRRHQGPPLRHRRQRPAPT